MSVLAFATFYLVTPNAFWYSNFQPEILGPLKIYLMFARLSKVARMSTRSYSSVPESTFPSVPACKHHDLSEKPAPEVGPIEQSIREKVSRELEPTYFDVKNDSWMHAHHLGMRGATNTSESHFSMVIISPKFAEFKNLPSRHRFVYGLLKDEMTNGGVHAIQMKTKTPEEWQKELKRAEREQKQDADE